MSESNELCKVYFEDFEKLFEKLNLTLVDKCPVCKSFGARHRRQTKVPLQSNKSNNSGHSSSNSLSATTLAFIKLKSQFPKWTKTTECKQFLKRIEMKSSPR